MIPAAGMGTRLGCSGPKALVDVGGKALVVRTLERFSPIGLLEDAVIIVTPGHENGFKSALARAFPGSPFTIVTGGAERQTSVQKGLDALSPNTEIVVIHDAARPFISQSTVTESMQAAAKCGAATVAIPAVDTVLRGDSGNWLVDTPPRHELWLCQTPQTFRVEVIRRAHAQAAEDDHVGTDDASLVRRMGERVKLIKGSPLNFKVTTPLDLKMAQWVVREGLA
jgi:2-C-methyl-D-erythritol 4-phosphate cytidylyltransferase